ncbi:hypothetical protein ACFVVA_37100 [Kitasatospora sp. NPDC058048]|uniref:hypothetical protein n=1 Tax=Kitasatospora sp. NPDC058048 TaxID=3346313 RepID=UPI0036DB4AF6
MFKLDNGRVALESPYHPELPSAAREIGGRWDAAARHWYFDARDEALVRDLALEIFGTDGSPAAEGDTVTIRLDISNTRQQDLRYGGRLIASRPEKKGPVRLGVGVILISGGFPAYGGTEKYPELEARKNTVVEVRDLPRKAVDLDDPDVTVVDEHVGVEALRAERERLAARLAEIDAVLASQDQTAQ